MSKKAANKLAFPINDLILFSIHSVLCNNEGCTFERLLNESFVLFPETLGFLTYPHWPDARKLDKPLRVLRTQNLIRGNNKSYFFLTKKGKERAMEVAKVLRQGKLL
jgi:hypothetical protein